jgi:plastocyanin
VTYTWSMYSGPAAVTFGATNGTNSGKSTVATFTQIGRYQIQCTAAYQGFQRSGVVEFENTGFAFSQAPSVTPNPVTGATATLTALVANGFGSESGVAYTWSMISGPAVVTFGASNGTNAGKSTEARFTQIGYYTFQCTASYQGIQVTDYVAVQNTAFTFSQAPSVNPNPVTGPTATLTALAANGFGPESGVTYTWSLSWGPAAVTFGASNGTNSGKSTEARFTQIGYYTFQCTASYQGIQVTDYVTVQNSALAFSQAPSVNPDPVTGATATLTALVANGFGPESGVTYTWSMYYGPAAVTFGATNGTNAGKSTEARFTQIGYYEFKCTASYQGLQVTAYVAVQNTALAFSQAPSVTPNPVTGPTATLTAMVANGFGPESGVTYTWSMNSGPAAVAFGVSNGTNAGKSMEVRFTKAGYYIIKCTASVGVWSTSQSVWMFVEALQFTTPPTAVSNPVLGDRVGVSALASTWYGPESGITYEWSGQGPGPVSFTVNGTNTAKLTEARFTMPGSYWLTCTARVGGLSVSRSIRLNVQGLRIVSANKTEVGPSDSSQLELFAEAVMGNVAASDIAYAWYARRDPASPERLLGIGQALRAQLEDSGSFQVVCRANYGYWNDEFVLNHWVAPIYFSKSPWADPAVVVPGQSTGLAAEAVAPGLDAQAIVYTWRQVSGPAQATFGVNASPAAKTSTASFPMVGDYALEGKASLGGREAIFPLTVAVREMGFIKAPTVGTWAPSGDRVNLQALASAAGISSQEIVYTWTMHTGPAPVVFEVNGTNAAATTQVTFTQNGHYDLECTASAGGRSVTAEVGVWVTPLLFSQAPRVFPTAEGGRLEALAQFAGASTGDITYTWTSEGPGVVAFGAENATAAGTVVRASVPTSGAYRFRCVARRGTFSTAKEVYVQIDVSASRDDGGGVLVRRRFAPGSAASLPLLRLQSTAVLLGKGSHVLVLNGPPGATVVAEALESAQVLDAQVTCSPSGRAEMRVNVLGDRARVLCWSPQARGAITLTSVVE